MNFRIYNLPIYFFVLPAVFSAGSISADADAPIRFSGNSKPVISVLPEKNTGLDCIFVLYDTNNVSMFYDKNTDSHVEWSIFNNMGGAYSVPIDNVVYDGLFSGIVDIKGDSGYIINDGGSGFKFWIVDYSNHLFNVDGIGISESSDCNTTMLSVDCNSSPIYYYTINGRRETLDRDISLSYDNLVWNSENNNFIQTNICKSFPYLDNSISLSPPVYCPTTFELTGDRFLKEWGMTESAECSLQNPVAVNVATTAVQEDKNNVSDNVISTDTDGFGGSAPCRISFSAFSTDAVVHHEWQIADNPDFENPDYRFNRQDVDFTFSDEGTFYVRYVGSDSEGVCSAFGDTYTVNIGSSELKVPNIFTPDGDGINDIWKVAFRSLLDFDCRIFNRNGVEIFRFTDPSSGWDGTYRGRKVKPGVYFYVISATGADGKRYRKSGDINIITHKETGASSPDL